LRAAVNQHERRIFSVTLKIRRFEQEALDARVEQLREQLAKVEREASEADKERRGAERGREMAEKAKRLGIDAIILTST